MTTEELLKRKKELESLAARYENIQWSKKIQLNAVYGAFGNRYFRYYDTRIAGSVTMTGRYVIRHIEKEINEYFTKIFGTPEKDYVIFCHTDSIYLDLSEIVKKVCPGKSKLATTKQLVKICDKKISKKIESILKKSALYINAYENRMNMKLEIIADRGIWTGKNRYVLNIYYKEGDFYKHPDLKTVGIEVVKSNIPHCCREKIRTSLEIIMRENVVPLRKFIKSFREEYDSLVLEDIAIPTGIKGGLEKYGTKKNIYVKGTPKHVKGSLIFNHYVDELGLDKKYKKISEGDKIKILSLRLPNPIHQTVIAFPNILPKEFGLEDYVDREQMFTVSFMNPVKKVLDATRWELRDLPSIESIFEVV